MERSGDHGDLRTAILLRTQPWRPWLREEDVFAEPLDGGQGGGRLRQRGPGIRMAVLGDQPEYVLGCPGVVPDADGQIDHRPAPPAMAPRSAASRPRRTPASAAKARWCST